MGGPPWSRCVGLLISVASLVVKLGSGVRGLSSVAPGLWSTGSIVVAHELSCSVACGIFLDQGSNLCLLHWQEDSLPLNRQGSPKSQILNGPFYPITCPLPRSPSDIKSQPELSFSLHGASSTDTTLAQNVTSSVYLTHTMDPTNSLAHQ